MPAMYFRVGFDANKRITDVAVSKAQGATGNWYHVDSFYYGCYGGAVSDGKLTSVSGVTRQAIKTRAEFRAYAAANGAGYFQRDLYHDTVMKYLWLIEWATTNSASVMTGCINSTGTTAGSLSVNTGGTDSVTTPSGYELTRHQMRWHYIEDFIGNFNEFVDGIVGSESDYYVTSNPTNYGDTTEGYNALSYSFPANASSTHRCISALGWDINNLFLSRQIEVNGVNYEIQFCDSSSTSNNVVAVVGSASTSSTTTYGLFYNGLVSATTTNATYSSRLLYKPTT